MLPQSFKKFLLYAALLAVLVTGGSTRKYSRALITDVSPDGEVSLQREKTNDGQRAILDAWQRVNIKLVFFEKEKPGEERLNGLQIARDNIYADFAFIPSYALLLLVLLFIAEPVTGKKGYLVLCFSLVLGAAFADILEDWRMLSVINAYPGHSRVSALSVWWPSTIKWSLLIASVSLLLYRLLVSNLLLAFLKRISKMLDTFAGLCWRFRIVLLSLLVLFAAFWMSDQGRELLLILNSSRPGVIIFLVMVSIWAALNWYLPKYYAPAVPLTFRDLFKEPPVFSPVNTLQKLDLARLLGAATFLVPAVCILDAMQSFHIRYTGDFLSPLVLLAGVLTLYYYASKNFWLQKIYTGAAGVNDQAVWLTVLVCLLVISGLGIFGSEIRKPYYLAWLSVDLLLLSFCFLLITTLRESLPQTAKLSFRLLVFIPAGLVFLFFLVVSIFPRLIMLTNDWRFLTLPVVVSAVIFYVVLFSFLLLVGRAWRFHLITLVLVVGAFFSANTISSFHEVRSVPSTDSVSTELRGFIRGWLDYRKEEIAAFATAHPGKPYPVFFVSSYGGGIKAAAWASLVLGKADSLTRTGRGSQALHGDFQHYALAYSGASGGTIGFSVEVASRYRQLRESEKGEAISPDMTAFYQNDFLTPVLVGLLGRDALMSSIGRAWYTDRSVLQDLNWEKHAAAVGIPYGLNFRDYWRGESMFEVPLLFANTYDIDSGQKGIMAPVGLSAGDFPATVRIRELFKGTVDLKMSTGAFLSARFPFVSPTGKITGSHHFGDGGYRENSGTETLLEVLRVFEEVLQERQQAEPVIYGNVLPRVIVLSNTVTGTESFARQRNLYELTAPLVGLMNNRSGNAVKAEVVLGDYARSKKYPFYRIAPQMLETSDGVWPVLPLGWQISNDGLLQMKMSVDRDVAIREIAGSVMARTR